MQPLDISWEAPEFEIREKGVGWYWWTIIIAVLILGAAVWQRNFLFAVIVTIGEILILIWSAKEPRMIPFHLTEKGLLIDGKTQYPMADFHSFSVEPDEHLHWPVIAFILRRKFRPPIHVRVPQERLAQIREHLALVVHETPWEESLIDTLEKFLRF
ncbi:MAG: hypothetical protein RL681_487 [Candidatus Parcubacteria bacterium]|jgi:hypothetical protein